MDLNWDDTSDEKMKDVQDNTSDAETICGSEDFDAESILDAEELVEDFFQPKKFKRTVSKSQEKNDSVQAEVTVDHVCDQNQSTDSQIVASVAEHNSRSFVADCWEDFDVDAMAQAQEDASAEAAAKAAAAKAAAAKTAEATAEDFRKSKPVVVQFSGIAYRVKNRAWIGLSSIGKQDSLYHTLKSMGLKTQDVFVHQKDVPKELAYEAKVRFTVVAHQNGVMPQAVEVSIVKTA